jgi:hypothetical protein
MIAANELEKLSHFATEIEKSITLWQQELLRGDVPRREIADRRRALVERLERLALEAHSMGHPFERVVAHLERLREMIIDYEWPAAIQDVPLHGRVLPTPGRPTATVEILVTSGLDWQPAATATIVNRRFDIVEHGTTRPGPIVAGSLIRMEVAVAPDNVQRAGTIELECGDSVLVVALDVAN